MWIIKWEGKALKELRHLDKLAQTTILKYLKNRIATEEDPRRFGKPLAGNKKGYWRYRIGDYRIICEMKDNELTVLVLAAKHRKTVYNVNLPI